MIRRCDGRDPFLTVCVDPRTGRRLVDYCGDEVHQTCNCRLTFDDEQRSTVWPHLPRVVAGAA